MVIKSRSIICLGLKKIFLVYICLAIFLPPLAGCMSRVHLKRLIPPPTRDEDVMIFQESESLVLSWGGIKDRAPTKFFDHGCFFYSIFSALFKWHQIGYIRETSGAQYELIFADYSPERLMGNLIKDVFQSQGIRFGESPYELEGTLVNFLVEGHKKIVCHIAMELKVVEKEKGDIVWHEFYEVKMSTPPEGGVLKLNEIYQDMVNQAFEDVEKQLREVDFLYKTKNELHLRKFKRKFDE